MLYDPKWEQKTKADPFSLVSLIAWLQKQNPNAHYDYCIPQECLIGQWLKSSGIAECGLKSHQVQRLFGGRGDDIVIPHPRTFGAALERARVL